jgi:hypothetical protein
MTELQFLERLERSGKGAEVLALIESLGFRRDFIVTNVVDQTGGVNVAHIAMLWQGMPNKHDRKRTRQLLDALTDIGLLTFDEPTETWASAP